MGHNLIAQIKKKKKSVLSWDKSLFDALKEDFKEPENAEWKSYPKYCEHIESRDNVQLGRLFSL